MRVIAVIERPAVIQQILAHLGLSSIAASLRAPPDQSDGVATDPPRAWTYEPFFDDLPVADPVMA
jgi:hypothetical protein